MAASIAEVLTLPKTANLPKRNMKNTSFLGEEGIATNAAKIVVFVRLNLGIQTN